MLSEPARAELEGVARRRNPPQGLALRARIVRRCAEGLTNQAVAGEVGACAHTVGKGRARFAAGRLAGLSDEPRSGAPRRIGGEALAALAARTLAATPAGATHWSRRSMARASGLSATTVGRVWRAFGLRPHRRETFKLSSDPEFVEEVRDSVGLYLAPPDRALVRWVDETAGVQALDRTQPLLPLRPGQLERRTHDDARHGTTSLVAAPDVGAGTVIGRCLRRHRAAEFRSCLDTVEAAVPAGLDVHVVMDNAGIHKTRLIRDWFAKRPRWRVPFTPTSASWLNQVERFFALLTDKAPRRGVHRSTPELEASIEADIAATNAGPRPCRWTKSADDSLAAIQRFCIRTLDTHEAQL